MSAGIIGALTGLAMMLFMNLSAGDGILVAFVAFLAVIAGTALINCFMNYDNAAGSGTVTATNVDSPYKNMPQGGSHGSYVNGAVPQQ